MSEISKQMKRESKILQVSFIASLVFTITEIIMGFVLRSSTITMDGVFDLADLILLGPFLILVPLLYKPVTEKHPYGYSQVESLFLIIKYGILLIVISVMIYENIRVIMNGGRDVDVGAVAVYEVVMSVMCLLFFLILRRASRKSDTPTLQAEVYMWKTDVVGSVSISLAFFVQIGFSHIPQIAFWDRYLDSVVAIIMALFLLVEPIRSIFIGIRELMLFAPEEETMGKIHAAVDLGLDGLPYTCSFLDVIMTGRKVWIEVYLTADRKTSLIDIRHWRKLRSIIKEELKDDFTQIYVELIPDIPEEEAEIAMQDNKITTEDVVMHAADEIMKKRMLEEKR